MHLAWVLYPTSLIRRSLSSSVRNVSPLYMRISIGMDKKLVLDNNNHLACKSIPVNATAEQVIGLNNMHDDLMFVDKPLQVTSVLTVKGVYVYVCVCVVCVCVYVCGMHKFNDEYYRECGHI
jgi:hypothetical protein